MSSHRIHWQPGVEEIVAREVAKARDGEAYTVEQIREAFAKHASPDDWGVPAFYERGLIAALRGEYDKPADPEEKP